MHVCMFCELIATLNINLILKLTFAFCSLTLKDEVTIIVSAHYCLALGRQWLVILNYMYYEANTLEIIKILTLTKLTM